MTTHSEQWFEKLKSNLEISNLLSTAVSKRQQELRDIIARDLEVRDVVGTGSYKRNTVIAPLEEINVEFSAVLDSKYYSPDRDHPANLLKRFKCVLRERFTEATDISRNGEAVSIDFSEFKVTVVPAFLLGGGGYLIPHAHGTRWISTDPQRQVEIWTKADMAQRGKLIPVIRMIKAWNKCHGLKLRSFHLEAIVLKVFATTSIGEYRFAVRDFFDEAQTHVHYVLDPSGHGGNLGYYLDFSSTHGVTDCLLQAYEGAQQAIYLEDVGKTDQARAKWGDIFGDYFPSYEQLVPAIRARREPLAMKFSR